MNELLTIKDLDCQGKTVLVRVDFNVPLDEEGNITDDLRIVAALPTIRLLLEKGAAVVLMSHLGRPKGKVDPKFSLKPCARRLEKLLGKTVQMAPDCVGKDILQMSKNLQSGDILLLENLRFYAAETEGDVEFVKRLAKLGDQYVNDAFGTAHRKHASTYAIASCFPGKAAVGLLLQKEIEVISSSLLHPKRPYVAIIGGKKISTKLGLLDALLDQVDSLLIGGAMAYTFFAAQGISIGESLVEKDCLGAASALLVSAKKKGVQLLLPQDVLVVQEICEGASQKTVDVDQGGIPEGWMGVGIGEKAVQAYKEVIRGAGTIFWNGPLGVFEIPEFAKSTFQIAEAVASVKGCTVVGGGDSVAAVRQMGFSDQMTHLSTGGGASLRYLEKGTLPAIESLKSNL